MKHVKKMTFVALLTCIAFSGGLLADGPEPIEDGFVIAYNVPACTAGECSTCNANGYGCAYSEGACYCVGDAPGTGIQ